MRFDECRPPAQKDSSPSGIGFTSIGTGDAGIDAVIRPAELRDRIFPMIFAGIFSAIGCMLLWFLAVQPMIIREHAKSWPSAQAIVESSHVTTHRGSKGNITYGFDILYRYNFNGMPYHSTHYGALDCSSPDYSSAERLTHQYPVGSSVMVYINPTDPSYSLVNREATARDYWVWAFLLFPAAGIFVFRSALTAQYVVTGSGYGRGRIQLYNTLEDAQKALAQRKAMIIKLKRMLGMDEK